MAEESRIQNSKLNILFGFANSFITTILGFVTRSVFIYTLGVNYLGLNGLYTNILSLLSLAELGIGSAITFSLYKPIAEHDNKKIKALMQLYKSAYQKIGIIILVVGLSLVPFLKYLVNFQQNVDINYQLIYVLFLADSVISYLFFAYRSVIVYANQKGYVLTKYETTFSIIRSVVQLLVLIIFKNYYMYLIIPIMISILKNLLISIKAGKMFPVINEKGKEELDKEEKDSKKTSATRDVNDFKDKNETRDEKALNNKNESSNKKVAKEQKDTKECRKAEGDDGAGVKGDRRSSVAALPSPAQGEIAPSRRLESPKGSSSKQKAKPSLKPASRFQAVSRASGDRPRRRVIPGKALERFGYLGTWPDFLRTLANLALDEPWDFCNQDIGEATRKYDILHNYIRYTFYRLTLEDKIGFSSDEDFAVFNTGLVDRHYEDIYACFEPSDPERPEEARYAWSFAGFCTAGTGRLGKRLVRELNPLPQPASYLERKEDLLFDLDREVVCDVHHIVVDNVHRLPVNFLRDELASSQECLGILAGIEDLTDGARGDRFEKLRIVIENDTRLFNRLSTSINAAIDVAKRQVRWNYKTAVPAYYPRTNSMNLLLPLILTDSPTPDVALVVELQKSGNYQGQTVVTMAQAYRDARLLCRPYIDWLSPASIIDAAEEEDEEE